MNGRGLEATLKHNFDRICKMTGNANQVDNARKTKTK